MSCIREICAICGHVSRVGFFVPDEVWKHAIHPFYQNSIVCLACFTERADEHLIDWSADIKFYPVSFAAHLEGRRPRLQDSETPDWVPTMREVQIHAIQSALRAGGSRRAAARLLAVPERTLYRRIRSFGLSTK